MKFLIVRHDEEEDHITAQEFASYDDAYDLLEEIYADLCCSDADYEDRPYYEIVEINSSQKEVRCIHCQRTPSNDKVCLGMCVADSDY